MSPNTTEVQLANLLNRVPKPIANDLAALITARANELAIEELTLAKGIKSWLYVQHRIKQLKQD